MIIDILLYHILWGIMSLFYAILYFQDVQFNVYTFIVVGKRYVIVWFTSGSQDVQYLSFLMWGFVLLFYKVLTVTVCDLCILIIGGKSYYSDWSVVM